MKKLTPETKKKIWGVVKKSLILVAVILVIAVVSLAILFLVLDINIKDVWSVISTQKEDNPLTLKLLAWRDEMGGSFWFWLVIGLLQVFQVLFIPISNQIVTVPLALAFPNDQWKVYVVSLISIWVSTLILYAIGRFAGPRLMRWMLRDEEEKNIEKYTEWLRRGKWFYIGGMLLPFPDDIITILAGTAKMSFWFVAISSLFTRAVDIAVSVFAWGNVFKDWKLTTAILVTLGLLLAIMVWFMWKRKKNRSVAE